MKRDGFLSGLSMEAKRIKLENFREEKFYISLPELNYMDKIPEEVLQYILSNLTSEELDKARLVNRSFNATCEYLLKKRYFRVKQKVTKCIENSRLDYTNAICDACRLFNDLSPTGKPRACFQPRLLDWIFWIIVNETLSNSFSYFDVLKGYLDSKYSVSGKTIDVVERILRFQKSLCPCLDLLESMFERDGENSVFQPYYYLTDIFTKWFTHKRKSYLKSDFIYRPLPLSRNKSCDVPTYSEVTGKMFHSMMLDVLTTLLTQENNYKEVLWWSTEEGETESYYQQVEGTPFIMAKKPVFKNDLSKDYDDSE